MNLINVSVENMTKMIQNSFATKENSKLNEYMKQLEAEYRQEKYYWWDGKTYYHFVIGLMARVGNHALGKSCCFYNVPLKVYLCAMCEGIDEANKKFNKGIIAKVDQDFPELKNVNYNIEELRDYLNECLEYYFKYEYNSNCLNCNGIIEILNYKYNFMTFKNYYEILGDKVNKYPEIENGHIVIKELGNDSYITKYNKFLKDYVNEFSKSLEFFSIQEDR